MVKNGKRDQVVNNFPCRDCGHTHLDGSAGNRFPSPTATCFINNQMGQYTCDCKNYVADNLKYLEAQYAKRPNADNYRVQ
jgi:hypothetical protein